MGSGLDRKYRSRIGILYDILRAIYTSETAAITTIIMEANIPHNRLKKIINSLLREGYITEKEIDGTIIYKLTPKGYRLMKDLERLKGLLEGLGLGI